MQTSRRGVGAVLAVQKAGVALQSCDVEVVPLRAEVAAVVVQLVAEQARVAQHLSSTVLGEGIPAGEAAQDGAGEALGLGTLGGCVVEGVDGAQVEIHSQIVLGLALLAIVLIAGQTVGVNRAGLALSAR